MPTAHTGHRANDLQAQVRTLGEGARQATAALAGASTERKDQALQAAADALRDNASRVLAANERDVAFGREKGLRASLIDRLALDRDRIEAMATGLETVAGLPDPVGTVTDNWTRPNGLSISRVRVPLGVIGIIYESRPNVTADAGALCLKSGNAVILRGGSESLHSSGAIVDCLHQGLQQADLPQAAIQIVDTRDRQAVGHLPGDVRSHRRHRAARRQIPDRTGTTGEPDPGHRPPRRNLPCLPRCSSRPRHGT